MQSVERRMVGERRIQAQGYTDSERRSGTDRRQGSSGSRNIGNTDEDRFHEDRMFGGGAQSRA